MYQLIEECRTRAIKKLALTSKDRGSTKTPERLKTSDNFSPFLGSALDGDNSIMDINESSGRTRSGARSSRNTQSEILRNRTLETVSWTNDGDESLRVAVEVRLYIYVNI